MIPNFYFNEFMLLDFHSYNCIPRQRKKTVPVKLTTTIYACIYFSRNVTFDHMMIKLSYNFYLFYFTIKMQHLQHKQELIKPLLLME